MSGSDLPELRRLAISSRFGDYEVRRSASIAAVLAHACADGKAWIVADEAVLMLHAAQIRTECPSERVLAIPATEAMKSFESLAPVMTTILGSGFRRDCTLMAIGGGVIQDITAFIATVLLRGVAWEFIPSTLLSQCDSCIGAKSSINISTFKNQLGSFHPPRCVHLIAPLLATLPAEAIRSGMGEVVKFHLVEGIPEWEAIRLMPSEPALSELERLVWRSLEIKRRYIEADELDVGMRNLLNYGHTFGHAFETASGFDIPHGLAVAMGMSAATFASQSRGLVSYDHFLEVDAVLRRLYAPFHRTIDASCVPRVLSAMRSDKKNDSTSNYVILTGGPGRMHKVKVDLEREIAPVLREFLAFISA